MRVLVTGAYGFIGSHIVAHLTSDGHEVVGAGRSVEEAARRWPAVRWIAVDFNRAMRAEDWLPHLAGIDAVVNCVGLLQDGPGNSVRATQVDGTLALFAACQRAGVRRLVHVSAVGVDKEHATAFMQTKREADAVLMASPLEWTILRPSVVVGRGAYGGSALIRALAALPGVMPVIPDAGELQIVQADDLAATVAFFLQPDAPGRMVLDVVGPERLSLVDAMLAYRRWLGLSAPRSVAVPRWLALAGYRLGDLAGWLGWRPPIRSTAGREIARGSVGDPAEWTRLTGIAPRSLAAALAAAPAAAQDRWFARLFLLKPVVIVVLAAFWIVTELVTIGPGYAAALALLREAGLDGAWGFAAGVGGATLDTLIGLGMVLRRTAKPALIASLIVSVVYLAIGTITLPWLWADPLGALTKIPVVLALTLVALAILDDR